MNASQIFEIYNYGCTLDTKRKLNVHKTSRRRPGRLLNVLCTFNLRVVSTAYGYIIFFVTMVNVFIRFNYIDVLTLVKFYRNKFSSGL